MVTRGSGQKYFSDYYPFGMPMPNRNNINNNYRYAYQGQEKDPETGKEAFELRLWDSRIGRWLTTDPAGQFDSPYLGMGNNPISAIDPDGGYAYGPPPFGSDILYGLASYYGRVKRNISSTFSNITDKISRASERKGGAYVLGRGSENFGASISPRYRTNIKDVYNMPTWLLPGAGGASLKSPFFSSFKTGWDTPGMIFSTVDGVNGAMNPKKIPTAEQITSVALFAEQDYHFVNVEYDTLYRVEGFVGGDRAIGNYGNAFGYRNAVKDVSIFSNEPFGMEIDSISVAIDKIVKRVE